MATLTCFLFLVGFLVGHSNSNPSRRCCKELKKEVEKYQKAYNVFCGSKIPTATPTTTNYTPRHSTNYTWPWIPSTKYASNYTSTTPFNPAPTTLVKGTCPNSKALGMQNGAIPNDAITASSEVSSSYSAFYGRLMRTSSGVSCIWAPRRNDSSPWIQIDLGRKTNITAVATQGSCNNFREYVTSYIIRYSQDGKTWTYYNYGQYFQANKDTSSVVKNEIKMPFEARFVRLYPKTMNNDYNSLRMELYGCRE